VGSYSRTLFRQPELLAAKIEEEAREFCEAQTRGELIHEAADIVYFTLARLVKENVPWREVEAELDRRALRTTRRGGEAKNRKHGSKPA
jgi:phosphoribosyl-ATP pyrophosphohydrolase